MKKFSNIVALLALTVAFAITAIAQDNQKKNEQFDKIAKLTQTKKPEDQAKAYKMAQDFVSQYGKDSNDTQVTKLKDFMVKYRLSAFNKNLEDDKTAEAFALGKEILAAEPENTYIFMNMAYGGYQAFDKKTDKTFADDSIKYAKQTLSLMEAGKVPTEYAPFKDKAEATALMYYIIGTFTLPTDAPEASRNFYKSLQFESQIKDTSYPYYGIAFGYEKNYENLAKQYQEKVAAKAPEAEMIALQEKLEKNIDLMLDAYARAIKLAEKDKNPGKDGWKQRFTQVYTFRKKSDAGLEEYIAASVSKPLPDPNNP